MTPLVPASIDETPPLTRVELSPRQAACITRVALGETSSEIATALSISVRTVDQYIGEACARLGVRKRASAVAEALRLGLICPAAARQVELRG